MEAQSRTLGPEHPDTLTSMNYLATVLGAQGRLDEAAVLGRQVLEARRRTLGPEHPQTLNSMNNLARRFQDQGKLDEAGHPLTPPGPGGSTSHARPRAPRHASVDDQPGHDAQGPGQAGRGGGS